MAPPEPDRSASHRWLALIGESGTGAACVKQAKPATDRGYLPAFWSLIWRTFFIIRRRCALSAEFKETVLVTRFFFAIAESVIQLDS